MSEKTAKQGDLCFGCVYYPLNLPRQAYTSEDWRMLQERQCAFECTPGDDECKSMRKTSCSLVDLGKTKLR